MTRPNILFMLADDHAVQAISALNRGRTQLNQTPHLDRIADEGAVFENSFCCNSICTPSRASILTGKHSFQNGVLTLEDALADDQTTFAGLLRGAGYQTALVGKWHLHSDPKDFDFWQVLPGQGSYYNPDYLTPEGRIRVNGYVEDITTDTVLTWLREGRDPAKPFLACCHFKAPHRPWMPPPRHYPLYDDHVFPEPESLRDDYADRCEVLKHNKMEIARHLRWNSDLKVHDAGPNQDRLGMVPASNAQHGEFEFDRMSPAQRAAWDAAYAARQVDIQARRLTDRELESWTYQAYVTDYLRCIAAIDDNVGRLLAYLDASGLADNTVVVYCSDQGFYLGEHRWFDKRWMFEESMRMPLLMRWPDRIPAGARYTQLVQNIDYAPTLLDACGIAVPGDMHGKSMWRIVEDGCELHDELYYHYYAHGGHGVPAHDGIRTRHHKLVHFYTEREFNLFDLERDGSEMRSLHDSPEHQALLNELKQRYWQARETFDIPDHHGPANTAQS
ncbi:MAG: sulfatase [Verrucomicrobia bacterium]|nr:sulfatase [Verrucomicrobiota bacterium]